MTPDQYTALLNEVLESNALARKNAHEITLLRGAVTKLEGAVVGLQGDIIILGVKVDINDEDIKKVNAMLQAMMQTIDGMNHLAKTAFDMSSSNVISIRGLEKFVGKPLDDEQPKQEAETKGGDGAGSAG